MFQSSNNNFLEWVEIYNAGNGETTYGTSKNAAVYVNSLTSGKLSMKDTYSYGSEAYGLIEKCGSYSVDEGSQNCNPNDAQTTLEKWILNPIETIITATNGGLSSSYSIVELTNSSLKYTEQVTRFDGGVETYTYTKPHLSQPTSGWLF
ncbi:MAG: hypothetical protein ACLFUB_19930 [Cyclobacteriaceae bacterium]